MSKMKEKSRNSKIARNFVSFADQPYKSHESWFEAKRNEDEAEGLWRVHDVLYDLDRFIDKHPGGRSWLELTKGTDITEAYETHHLNTDKTNAILQKYYVRKANEPRNIQLTFLDDGFYRTLKRRVSAYMQGRKCDAKFWTKELLSNIIIDTLLLATLIGAVLSTFAVWFVPLTAITMTWVVIAGHNYIHRRDNFRMFYFNLSFHSYDEWRISHVLSHHLYTNSLVDMEMAFLDPLVSWLPSAGKTLTMRYASWLYGPVLWSMFGLLDLLKRIVERLRKADRLVNGADLVPFSVPLVMLLFGGADAWTVLKLWLIIVCGSGFALALTGLNAGHHHPEVYHDGDETRTDMDWGIYQLDTMIDRRDLQHNHFLVLTNFGDHILHHMFPTLDHGVLNELYPIMRTTAREFGVESRSRVWPELIVGQHQQLARIEPSSRCRLEDEQRREKIAKPTM